MSVKASLSVRLFAGEVLVAESEDAGLWQRVLAAVQKAESPAGGAGAAAAFDTTGASGAATAKPMTANVRPGQGIEGFAQEIGVAPEVLEGALAPSNEAPYIHLDPHCWEALKRSTPTRGPGSVSGIALGATMLALWFRHAGNEGAPKIADAQAVLATIDLRDANALRGLSNTEWLQVRSGSIVINPALRSRALRIATAFCTKKPVAGGEQ